MSKKSFSKEFKEFISKGNVMNLAVGVIIGGAFQSIVNSLVNDIIMPVISLFTKGIDFSKLFIALDGKSYASLEAAKEANAAALSYGNFISAVLNFLIMAFVIFMLVKLLNKLTSGLKKKEEEPPKKEARKCPFCMQEIDDKASRCPHCTSELK